MKREMMIACFAMLFIFVAATQEQHPSQSLLLDDLGKGNMYLNEKRIIRNIWLKEIRAYWIIYEKDGNLHDRMMDEIEKLEFPKAKPQSTVIRFIDNTPVVQYITSEVKTQDNQRNW